MKLGNNLDNTDRITEGTTKKFVSSTEKTAITHSNRTVLDDLSDSNGTLQYKGSSIGGGVSNLTANTLTLGNFQINYNSTTNKLEVLYIGV